MLTDPSQKDVRTYREETEFVTFPSLRETVWYAGKWILVLVQFFLAGLSENNRNAMRWVGI